MYKSGRTAAFYALDSSTNSAMIIRLLAQHGCPLDTLNQAQTTCLSEAIDLNREGEGLSVFIIVKMQKKI